MVNQPIDAPRWDLSDLYSDINDPKINIDINDCQKIANAIALSKSALKQSPADIDLWVNTLEQYKQLVEIDNRLQTYARMVGDQDTSNEDAIALQNSIDEKITTISASLSFLSNFIIDLSDDDANKLYSHQLVKDQYAEFIRNTRRQKAHTLPEDEEKILIQTLYRERQAWSQLQNQISTRIPYPDIKIDDKSINLNESTINKYLESKNTDIRTKAYQSRCLGFEKEYETLSFIYINQNRNIRSEYQIRSYPDILSYISDRDDIPTGLIPNLFSSAKKYQSIFTEFYTWKAKELGVPMLTASDVIAPLPQSIDQNFSWNQGKEMILTAFKDLNTDFSKIANNFFTNNWIHAEPLPRKNTGAYCMPTVVHPYLLTNYQNNLSSINTLAHELGHGIHDSLAKKQSILQQHAGYIACETASQFSELLLLNYLEEHEPQIYKFELAQFLSRAMNAIFQQTLYTEFEFKAYTQASIQSLTPSWLAEQWINLRRELGKGSISFPDIERWNWARISHMFFHPFYCYSYAVSLLIVFTLFQMHKENPIEFTKQFNDFLSAGGSQNDHELLKKYFNLDLNDQEVLNRGFEILKQYTKKLL